MTVEELIARYETDPALRAEVETLRQKNKVTVGDLWKLAKKYDVDVSLWELPKYLRQAKELGLIQ